MHFSHTFACIDAAQNRAMRFYLGVGRYTPTAAVAGDMGWEPTIVKQWKCVGSFWYGQFSLNKENILI